MQNKERWYEIGVGFVELGIILCVAIMFSTAIEVIWGINVLFNSVAFLLYFVATKELKGLYDVLKIRIHNAGYTEIERDLYF